jgi:hypothetical protein
MSVPIRPKEKRHVPARQAIRSIIIFTILVNGLAWLGRVLGGDPSAPGRGN